MTFNSRYKQTTQINIIRTKIGFIGLGIMGNPMSKNLLKAGHEHVVCDLNRAAVEELIAAGAQAARTPRDIAQQVELVITMLPNSPGELKAVAYRQGKTVAQKTFRTAGDPGRIRLETDADNLKADRRDLATVQFSVTDDAGVMVPSADDRLDFKVIGPVRLRGYENGDPVDITPHQVSWRKVFYGLGRGFFQATDQPGDVEVAAAAVLGNRTFTTTTRVAIDAQRIALRGTLANADLVIHYTIDGREPTAAAPQYVVPFTIDRTTTVKSLVLRNGQPFLSTQAEFIRSVAPAASPPMASASSQPYSRYK